MTASVSLPDALPLADRQVFTANGVAFTVADLVRRAQVGGRVAIPRTPSAQHAEEAFRRARGLLTADQLEAWLATWWLDAADFRAWTEDAAAGTETASGWCALLCSGRFDETASALAAAAAAACELGIPPVDAASFEAADWVARLVELSTSPAGLAARVDAHRLEWTRLDTVQVTTARRGIAEELRHQVVTDGIELDDAARAAGLRTTTSSTTLDEHVPALRSALVGARAGELVGPVPTGDTWALVAVRSRTEPALEDDDSRIRAENTLRADAIARALARHVVA